MKERGLPKISIITPNLNQGKFLEATIRSVIFQKYPNLEYIIIDGGSTDGSIDIIKKYEKYISLWICERDKGMYDALNKGFRLSTGQIMGWINSDDQLMPDSLNTLARLFSDMPEVNWIQGLNSFIDLEGKVIKMQYPKKFSLERFLLKDFHWIMQESTFWRRNLWEAAGSRIDSNLKLAGDFELWFRFSQFEKLYNVSVPIGAWRKRDGQLSGTQMGHYLEEAHNVIKTFSMTPSMKMKIRKIKFLNRLISIGHKLKFFNIGIFNKRIYELCNLKNSDIRYSYEKKKFYIS